MNLQTRFPITYSKMKLFRDFKKIFPSLAIENGITFDKQAVPFLPHYQITQFIDIQLNNIELVNECFQHLIDIIEKRELNIYDDKTSMKKIYNLLEESHLFIDMFLIDNFVLFLKSQNEFYMYF